MIVNVSCIGVLVNIDTTSWELKMSSCSNVNKDNSAAKLFGIFNMMFRSADQRI